MRVDSASSSRGPRLPLGFAAMLVLLVLIESFIVSRDLDFVHPWSWDWRLTGQAARKEAKDCEILCLGDSLVKFGVPPRVLEARLGRKAYNLAIGAANAPTTYFLLRRAIEAGAKPKVIVVDYKPHLLTYDLDSYTRHWPEFLTARECLELAFETRSAGFALETLVGRCLPSVRARFEIRANVEAAWRNESSSPREAVVPAWRNWRVNRGAQIMPRNPFAASQKFAWTTDLFPPRWRPLPINRRYVDRLFAFAESRGILVYWVIPPLSPATQLESERIGLDRKYEAFVRQVQTRHPGVIVVDGRHADYGQDLHFDPIHLDRAGAAAFATDLAKIIKRSEHDSTRANLAWIALPRRLEQAIEPAPMMEDLEQSRIALQERLRQIKK